MKIPKTFIPSKRLYKKNEELKEPIPQEVNLEELMQNSMKILFGDATDSQRNRLIYNAVSKVIEDTFKGGINWEEIPGYAQYSKAYKGKATVSNHEGKYLTIPVFFQVNARWGYLHLGNKGGPCINSLDERIKQLAKECFEINLE